MRFACGLLLLLLPIACFFGCSTHHRGQAEETESRRVDLRFRFVDVTAESGIRWKRSNGAFGKKWMPETMGGGGAFIDYDNDGDLDILLVNGDWWPGHPVPGPRPALALYRRTYNGRFDDVTAAAGWNVSLQGMGAAVGDYDNDGFDDICITGVGGNRLFHNEGGKRFIDVTQSSGIKGQ